ncbi:MAG: ethanolamine ammonia-lyase reactivating factor EutA [Burkholderiaceae bacterium]|nr:ethanolamine ammonia-lyase reactivating factor EutA [Burkholderiaceae bacterium]
MSARIIHSVGIDIGTTTTQVIFSRLALMNAAGPSEVPRYEITEREVIFLSPIVPTPVDFEGSIHGDELLAFIHAQYAAAGLSRAEVESGAIIITGETSKAANARETVLGMADLLGDFVVATAGPHLESVIAGHGSGAMEASRSGAMRVVNIDIGGGTSNFAVFRNGQLLDTACLNVGGHLVEFERDEQVRHLHKPARRVLEELRGARSTSAGPSRSEVQAIARRMAELLVEILEGRVSPLAQDLLMTPPLKELAPFDAVYLSGGVGECFYRGCDLGDGGGAFADIGPQLADAMRRNASLAGMPLREPRQTLRATVIGAGAHTVSLSGSTIWLRSDSLPLRNVPVLHCLEPQPASAQVLAQAWADSARVQDLEPARDRFALAVPGELPLSYKSVLLCAEAVQRFVAASGMPGQGPLIVIARQDFGKSLGLELAASLAEREIAVIDEVQVREYDYIDIGRGLFGGAVVPLTIKSLAFPG